MKRMVGHNFIRAMVQKFTLVRENSVQLKREGMDYPTQVKRLEDFYDLGRSKFHSQMYDFENMTVLFANSGQKYDGGGLFLQPYFDIASLK